MLSARTSGVRCSFGIAVPFSWDGTRKGVKLTVMVCEMVQLRRTNGVGGRGSETNVGPWLPLPEKIVASLRI
jgi:hypothetical protein